MFDIFNQISLLNAQAPKIKETYVIVGSLDDNK